VVELGEWLCMNHPTETDPFSNGILPDIGTLYKVT